VAISVAWLSHSYAAERERATRDATIATGRRTFLRDKLESLVALVGEHCDAQQRYGMEVVALGVYSSRGLDSPDIVSGDDTSGERADEIATLYFPSLASEMLALGAATVKNTAFGVDELGTMRANSAGYADGAAKTASGRMAMALMPMVYARKALGVKARKIIEEE